MKTSRIKWLLPFSFFLTILNNEVSGQKQYSYVFRLGNDTVAFEQYTRTKEIIEGDILNLYPRVLSAHFKIELGATGTVRKMEMNSRYLTALPGAQAVIERTCIIEDTIVIQDYKRNGKKDSIFSGRFRIQPGAVPVLDNDISMFEQMLLQATATGKDSVSIQRFSNSPMSSYIKKIADGLFESKVFFFPVQIKAKGQEQILSLDATSSTIKTIATLSPAFDFAQLSAAYAEKEKLAGNAGLLSPSDTTRASFKGADFQITYGRPLKRGREIFGNIVPWNKVWRLGGNFATHFSTTKDLQFGEFVLPAGRYTLWMIPGKNTCELIINKMVNIFGTQYDPSKDLVRLPMTASGLSAPVEKLTIGIRENNTGGEIVVQWDLLQAIIAFKIN